MSELGRFQDAFTEALHGGFQELAEWASGHDAELRVSVYRNTVAKGCADALAAQFPTVLRVAGEAWMQDAAVRFAREHPPVRPALVDYGAGFAAWLSGFPPAADMPWLSALARIDWSRSRAQFAADAPPLDPAALAALAPERYGEVAAELHPAVQVLWFDAALPSLWRALQAPEPPTELELGPESEGLLLARPEMDVAWRVLGRGAFAFLAACRSGLSLAAAGEAALAAEPDLALAETFADLIAAGAFARLAPARPESSR